MEKINFAPLCLSGDNKMQAIVFGLFETGLGVIRSLGQSGIRVFGVDYKKDIGWYSRYVKPLKCPHPIAKEKAFLQWVDSNFSELVDKIPAFFTSDDFLGVFSKNRETLSQYFIFNLPEHDLLCKISDKYKQYLIAKEIGINLPHTYVINTLSDFKRLNSFQLPFPLFIKGLDVNTWRTKISGSIKGFVAENVDQLTEITSKIIKHNVPVIIQEIISGPDTNHFKYCAYINKEGDISAEFTLQKIRQNPIHFGVGAVVESINFPELIIEGRKLFIGISLKGIASAEFKKDERDGKLKLIEINPRYWQQNYLSTECGINFPYINFRDLKNEAPAPINQCKTGIKWVNRYMDFDSFLTYHRKGSLSFRQWRQSLKGPKVYPDFIWSDPLPAFYEIGFGIKLLKIPGFLIKKLKCQ